jgi:hypothetical protein
MTLNYCTIFMPVPNVFSHLFNWLSGVFFSFFHFFPNGENKYIFYPSSKNSLKTWVKKNLCFPAVIFTNFLRFLLS